MKVRFLQDLTVCEMRQWVNLFDDEPTYTATNLKTGDVREVGSIERKEKIKKGRNTRLFFPSDHPLQVTLENVPSYAYEIISE